MARSRILVIEDEPCVRDAVCAAIADTPELCVANATGEHDDAARLIAEGGFELALIDLDLNGRTGLDLIGPATQDGKPAMVLSLLGDETHVIAAIEAGASGYVLKSDGLDRVPGAIRKVLQGEAPLSPAVARHLLSRFQPSTSTPFSRREREVLEHFAHGATYAQTAAALDISIHTLGDYVKSLYRKLQVSSRAGAVHAAVKSGWLKI